MLNRIIAILVARNKEFVRDRGTLAWNFILPIFLLVGFSFMFGGDGKALYKIGVLTGEKIDIKEFQSDFLNLKHIEQVKYTDLKSAILKVDQHKIDLLVDFANKQYWINETSSKGYIAENLLLAKHKDFEVQKTSGKAVRYVDWVMPGILGMNMMFSCLFGVGYVIVRYRKNGVLKRFQATPLTAFEFLSAQVLSRLSIVLIVTVILFVGSNLILDFYVLGSSFDLFIVALVGATSLISLSLLIASISHSEELVGGLLNMVSWPMMFLSGVWFSLEGAHPYVQQAASVLPLTHILQAARAITTDGVALAGVQSHLYILIAMTIVFLSLGSWLFDWGSERT
ncbi:MAG: ABC transporter permease [Kangiella sp.]|nr:MAG: ABC transporter permease [Kangiella sp.]